ncbi:MAG: hypothetical protein Metus_1484 [Candidatus Methanosuratincola subterraneus]|uniref:DUF47 family protein n=1 Tax=Methanosuratincola subterraneus TaxID=2593994 RepID=A0A444L7J0_METS7|nr:MAG: hypothetical protein Metus_1484 [Candidatus Methanosuratincola subterraneus]
MWRRLASLPFRGTSEKLREHQSLVLKSVELLGELVSACRMGDWAQVRSTAERIAALEREADEVKRGIEINLYKGTLFVGLKEDFLRLAEALDAISDRAKDASRIISSREPRQGELQAFFQDCPNVERLIAGTIEIVRDLEGAVGLLDKDSKEAIAAAHRVEKTEERLDEIKLDILMQLSRHESEFSTLTYLQLRDFILMVDAIADAAEDGSDVLTAMILKATF